MPIAGYRGIVVEKVEEYMQDLLPPRDKVLKRLEADAEKNDVPIVGPMVGSFLSLLANSCGAKNILEVGTATGYSGIWLAKVAKKNGGKLTTIEFDPERVKVATKSFDDADIADSVEILQGDARKIIPDVAKKNAGYFDVVFIDVGDKTLYVDLLDDCVNSLRVGGFLLADNTLWMGRVASPAKDKDTEIIQKFNKKVYADKRLDKSIVPLRDGVTVALKVSER
jgi:caffeoyl-CoA O-methyltransferase